MQADSSRKLCIEIKISDACPAETQPACMICKWYPKYCLIRPKGPRWGSSRPFGPLHPRARRARVHVAPTEKVFLPFRCLDLDLAKFFFSRGQYVPDEVSNYFYTQSVILHKVCSFTHSDLWNKYERLCSVTVVYAVLSREHFCRILRIFGCKIFTPQNMWV